MPTSGKQKRNNSDIIPYVAKPVSSNVTWLSSSSEYSYGGKKYVVQTLTAQPNSRSSKLKLSGSKALSSIYKWKAGVMNAIKTVASVTAGNIPGTNRAVIVYDTAKAFVSGISKTTEISKASIVYSYSHTTTVSFKYVKLKGEPDSKQSLTYVSTKGATAIGYQYPTFNYAGEAAKPNIIQGSRTINATPDGYNSTLNAVKAYANPYASKRAYVNSVKITGIESKTAATIYPTCPEFPAQIFRKRESL